MAGIPLQPETRAARALSLTVTALMVALGMLALAGAVASRHIEARWHAGLADRWTVELPAPDPDKPVPAAIVDRAISTLHAMPGIADAKAIGPDEIRRLLSPLLGDGAAMAELPLPVLIDVTVDPAHRPAPAAVAARLSEAVPGARLDDHGAWTHDLTRLAGTGEAIGMALLGIVALAAISGIVSSVRARLAVNRVEIELLYTIGASDFYIARQFQASALRLAIFGLIVGTILAASAVAGLVALMRSFGTLLPETGIEPADWVALAAVPIAAILLAASVARMTALSLVRRLP